MPAPLTLSASAVADWQACPRRYLLARDWQVLRWRPRALFERGLRRAVLAISNGQAVERAIAEAKAAFFDIAASPGLDIPPGGDPYRLARDWCAMYETILRVVADRGLDRLHAPAEVTIADRTTWRLSAAADDSGVLHRWIALDRADEDSLTREAHSWRTVGDMAVADVPLILHVVEIGQTRDGRRASPWARAFRHPTMPNLRVRFKTRDPKSAKLAGWTPVYLADLPPTEIPVWLEQMRADGVDRALVHAYNIRQLSSRAVEATRQDIIRLSLDIRRALDARLATDPAPWLRLPMHRNACDWIGAPCPYQPVCYGEEVLRPDSLGLYSLRLPGSDDAVHNGASPAGGSLA